MAGNSHTGGSFGGFALVRGAGVTVHVTAFGKPLVHVETAGVVTPVHIERVTIRSVVRK